MKLEHDFLLPNMRNYRRYITMDMELLGFEGPEKQRKGMVRSPFPMKKLANALNWNVIAEIYHAI